MRPPLPLLVRLRAYRCCTAQKRSADSKLIHRKKFEEKKAYYQHPTSIHVSVEEPFTYQQRTHAPEEVRACYGFLTFSAIRYIC